MDNSERFADLELRLIRQDDLLETLNTQVYRQTQKIEELEKLCTALARSLRDLAQTAVLKSNPSDERPPHY